MSVFLFGSGFSKVDVAAAADKYSSACASLELMVMSVGKIRVEADLMHMVVAADLNGFATHGCKTMVVGIIAAAEYLRAAQYLMDMSLSASAVAVTVTVAILVAIPVTVATIAVPITVAIPVTITVTIPIPITRFLLLTIRPAGTSHNGLKIHSHRNALLSE